MNTKLDFSEKLKEILHDPIDKPFDIRGHKRRAEEYAQALGVRWEDIKGSDWISSCMERSLIPEGIVQDFDEIRHPFSESRIENNFLRFKKEVFDVVNQIAKRMGDVLLQEEYDRKFLYIWRNYQENLIEGSNGREWKKYIPLFPADTRIPDHSIWEHSKITSAVNALWDDENKSLLQNNSLFLLSIGPVQTFISQTRKTQDLFMSSFLLSYLTFVAMEKIIEDYGPTNIIYPDLYKQPLVDWWLETRKKIEVTNSQSKYVDLPTIPNRFVSFVPQSDKKELQKLGEEIAERVRNEWRQIVFSTLQSHNINFLNDERVKRHIEQFPEIYWVALPLKIVDRDIKIEDLAGFFESTEKYKHIWEFAAQNGEHPPNIGLLYQIVYSSLEKSMGARKNLRGFEYAEEYDKKCHLCGEREGWIKAGVGDLKVGRYIGDSEVLCTICFVKRALGDHYLKEKFKNTSNNPFQNYSFPSTAEIATSDFKLMCLEKAGDDLKAYIETFITVVGEARVREITTMPLPKIMNKHTDFENLEGEWFFDENLSSQQFKKQLGINLKEGQINELKEKLRSLINKVGAPNPYYAVIIFDADSMGKWLSGWNLPDIENAYNSSVWQSLPDDFKAKLKEITPKKPLTPAIHASISTALRNYTIEFVRTIVEEEHLGKLVYAGGDDVLAFVNLKDLFEVMRKLRAAFSGHIKIENGVTKVCWENESGFIEKDGVYYLTMGKNATASCGAVIAHYKTPLKLVLDKAREMEKKAKNIDEKKDAFGIALMKHSGQVKEALCKWKYDDIDVLETLVDFADKLEEKEDKPWISKRFIYRLTEEFERVKGEDGYLQVSGAIFEAELKRTIMRACHGEKYAKKEMVKSVSDNLSLLFFETGAFLDRFLNLLEIATFTVKAED